MAADTTNSGSARAKTPIHLWIVGVLSLLWNAMGAFDYLATHLALESYVSQLSAEQMAYFEAFPSWAVAGWALGVWGSLAGSTGLLARRNWAVWAFAISLFGLLVSSIYNFGLSNGAEIMGDAGVIFTIVIWVVAILLFFYARRQSQRGVLA